MENSNFNSSQPKISFWQRFIRAFATVNELQVWQKKDRHGNIYWQAYDPATGHSTSLGSEAEMRMWIEQINYKSKSFLNNLQDY